MTLTDGQANAIALLLNTRNQLTTKYDRAKVLADADDYICRMIQDEEIIACVKVKRVQWYQCEILHLTVAAPHEGNGYAKDLLTEAEVRCHKKGARILQCTIRSDNTASQQLFKKCGYTLANKFLNTESSNVIQIWQKILVIAP